MPIVRIPTQLRPLTSGASTVTVAGDTVGEVLSNLDQRYPGFAGRMLDDTGRVRRFINVFVDEEDVRFRELLTTKVTAGATISIVPAVAGGSS
jgi:molybdopterin synthase sulfur carrier subunit